MPTMRSGGIRRRHSRNAAAALRLEFDWNVNAFRPVELGRRTLPLGVAESPLPLHRTADRVGMPVNTLNTSASKAACVATRVAAFVLPLAAAAAEPAGGDLADLEALLNRPVYAASKFAQDAMRAPAAVTVLTAGDIRAYGWRTLAEVLDGARGVYLRYDRFYQYVGVRGLGRPGDFSSRLLILIDGMRVNDNIYGQAGVGREFPLDVGLIERVEFIPGPGSALYGSNAVLGVVNIVTKSAVDLPGQAVRVETGSNASRLVSVSSGHDLGDGGRLLLAARSESRPGQDLYFREYDDPATAGGRSNGADGEGDRKLYAKWSLGEWTASALMSQRRKRIPTGAFDTIFGSHDTVGTDRYVMTDLQWTHRLDAEQDVIVRGGIAQYAFEGRFDYPAPDSRQHLDQTGRWASVEARWQYTGLRDHRLIVGVEAQDNLLQRQTSSFEPPATTPTSSIDGTSHRYGLFASDEITLTRTLQAVVGGRLDRQFNGDHTVTPRGALIWDAAPGLVLKALQGRAYREPNAYESQFRDITAVANPGLQAETLHASELTMEWRSLPNLRLSASAYRYKVANLIEQQVQPVTGLLVFNNAGTVRARGLELEADYVDPSGWRARASWARQRTHDGAGDEIGNSPTSLTKLHASVPIAPWSARVGVEWLRMGERMTLAGDRLPDHAVTNVTMQFAPAGSRVSWAASVYNVFDRRYADPGGPELVQDAVEQDGREWRLQLSLQF